MKKNIKIKFILFLLIFINILNSKNLKDIEIEIFNKINEIRLENNLSKIKFDKELQKLSLNQNLYSKEFNIITHFQNFKDSNNYFGYDILERFKKANLFEKYEDITENIIFTTNKKQIINKLLNSIYHRFSIIDYNSIGIGISIIKYKNGFLTNITNGLSYSKKKYFNIYPKNNNVLPFFKSEEEFPKINKNKYVGIPITIQTNEKINKITLLEKNNNKPIKSIFKKTNNIYSLIPIEKLKFDTKYKIIYKIKDEEQYKEILFKTIYYQPILINGEINKKITANIKNNKIILFLKNLDKYNEIKSIFINKNIKFDINENNELTIFLEKIKKDLKKINFKILDYYDIEYDYTIFIK